MNEPDQRLLRAIRELDEERQARIKAEKSVIALKASIAKMQKRRTADAAKQTPEQRATC